MFIENDELKALIEKEQELTEQIKPLKERVAELTEEMKTIQDDNKAILDEMQGVRESIAKIFVPIALESLGDTEMFGDIEIKDGKPFVNIVDVTETAIEEAKKGIVASKKDWLDYLAKLEKK